VTECKNCDDGSRVSGVRRRVIRNGSVQLVRQCLNCGSAVGNPVKQSAVTGGITQWDESLETSYRARHAELREQERAKFFEGYSEYLRSPEWKRRREKVMARAKGICEGCGDALATQVHHLTYEHVGNEFLFELVAICHECHERIHPHMSE
jgi:hypothetical protein